MNRVWQYLFMDQETNPVSHFTDFESYLLAVKKISWVYSCSSLIGYTIASADWDIYKRGTDDIVEHHEYRDLLTNPNDHQSYMDITEEGVQHLVLTGQWYEAHEQINAYGQPKEMFNLRPSRVTIVPSAIDMIKGYVYEVNSRKIPFDVLELLHYKLPNPTDELYGLGLIEAG